MINFSEFACALHDESGKEIKMLPKSDLHNHAGRGGNISYLMNTLGIEIVPFKGVFSDIESMDSWFKRNIQSKLPRGLDNYLKRVETNFVSAEENHIVSLALDFGIGEIYKMGGMLSFIRIITGLRKQYAPNTRLIPVLVIRELSGLEYLQEIFSYNWFKARFNYITIDDLEWAYSIVYNKLIEYGFLKHIKDLIPCRQKESCIMKSINKVIVSSNGKLYKCLQEVFNAESAVGDLKNGINNKKILDCCGIELHKNCKDCVYLPVCSGGCAAYWNLSKVEKVSPCVREKYFMDMLLDMIHTWGENMK